MVTMHKSSLKRFNSFSVGHASQQSGNGNALPSESIHPTADCVRFDKHGRVLSAEESEKICKLRGLCLTCGRPTHKVVSLLNKRRPLNNEFVKDGVCLVCNPPNSSATKNSRRMGALHRSGSMPVTNTSHSISATAPAPLSRTSSLYSNGAFSSSSLPLGVRTGAAGSARRPAGPSRARSSYSLPASRSRWEEVEDEDDENDLSTSAEVDLSAMRRKSENRTADGFSDLGVHSETRKQSSRGSEASMSSLKEMLRENGIDPDEFLKQSVMESANPGRAYTPPDDIVSDEEGNGVDDSGEGGRQDSKLADLLLLNGLNPEESWEASPGSLTNAEVSGDEEDKPQKDDKYSSDEARAARRAKRKERRRHRVKAAAAEVAPQSPRPTAADDETESRRNSNGDDSHSAQGVGQPNRRKHRKNQHKSNLTKSLKDSLTLSGYDPEEFIRETEEAAANEEQMRVSHQNDSVSASAAAVLSTLEEGSNFDDDEYEEREIRPPVPDDEDSEGSNSGNERNENDDAQEMQTQPKRRKARKKHHKSKLTKSLKDSLTLSGFDPEEFIRESEEAAAKESKARAKELQARELAPNTGIGHKTSSRKKTHKTDITQKLNDSLTLSDFNSEELLHENKEEAESSSSSKGRFNFQRAEKVVKENDFDNASYDLFSISES